MKPDIAMTIEDELRLQLGVLLSAGEIGVHAFELLNDLIANVCAEHVGADE